MLSLKFLLDLADFNADHPRYLEANTVCTMFDIQSGPDSVPVSRFSFDVKVYRATILTSNLHILLCAA